MKLNAFDKTQKASARHIATSDLRGRINLSDLLVAGALLLTPFWALASSVSYNPTANTTQTVEQGAESLPFSFKATSPSLPATGKPKQTPYERNGGVCADYIAKDLSYTYNDPDTEEPVTVPFDFSNWININPGLHCYSGPAEGPEVSATVEVPGNAQLGLYTAKLVAKAANGIGWGEAAGVHITVNVVAPSATDTTPPVVTIAEPGLTAGNPQDFILGNRIPVNFTSVDQQSPVTAWTADLYPGPVDVSASLSISAIPEGLEADGYILSAVSGGTETIQAIGQYELQVTATSAGGTSDPASRSFTINYLINPIAPDMTASNLVWSKSSNQQGKCSNSNPGPMQVKFSALAVQPADTTFMDNSEDAFVADESVRIQIVNNLDNAVIVDRVYGNSDTSAVKIDGTTGDASGNYLTKVNLCTAPNGTYTIRAYFKDHSDVDFLQYSKTFTLQD